MSYLYLVTASYMSDVTHWLLLHLVFLICFYLPSKTKVLLWGTWTVSINIYNDLSLKSILSTSLLLDVFGSLQPALPLLCGRIWLWLKYKTNYFHFLSINRPTVLFMCTHAYTGHKWHTRTSTHTRAGASFSDGCFPTFMLLHLHNTDLKSWLYADWPELPSACLIIHLNDLRLMGLAHPVICIACRNGSLLPLSNQWTGWESVSLTGDIRKLWCNHWRQHHPKWGICNHKVDCAFSGAACFCFFSHTYLQETALTWISSLVVTFVSFIPVTPWIAIEITYQ